MLSVKETLHFRFFPEHHSSVNRKSAKATVLLGHKKIFFKGPIRGHLCQLTKTAETTAMVCCYAEWQHTTV